MEGIDVELAVLCVYMCLNVSLGTLIDPYIVCKCVGACVCVTGCWNWPEDK